MAKKNETKLNYRDTLRELKANGPQRLYLLWGAEDYLSESFAQEIKKLCVTDGTDDFSYRRINEAELTPRLLQEAIDSVPFMSERSMVEVRGADLNKLRDREGDEIIKLLSDIPDYCTVVFIQQPTFEPDKRLKFMKAFLKLAVELHFTAQQGELLISWIVRHFSAAGKGIELSAAQRLIAVSGDLMNGLIPEINKVAAYAKGEKVTVSDVDAVAHHIPEAVVFEMTDKLSAGEYDAAMELLSELLADKNNEPLMLLAMTGMQMRRLYAARVAIDSGLGKEQVMKTCGIKYDFIATKLIVSARRFSASALRRAVELCCVTDYKMKSTATDPTELLKECIARIAAGESDA